MDQTYWHKQGDEPLFPDLLWSKPENKHSAGKLLIIGGNSFGMSAPAEAYQVAVENGIGTAKVILPDSLHKTLGNHLEHVTFAPSNKSGGFSQQALTEWLEHAAWADAVLLAGDTARNSETAIVMEKFVEKYQGPLTLTQDCVDQFVLRPTVLIARPDTTIVVSFAQLQKMWPRLTQTTEPIQFANSLATNISLLHKLTSTLQLHIIVKISDHLAIASRGQVSTTPNNQEIWRVHTATKATVWWLQNLQNPHQAMSTAVYQNNG